MSFIKLDENHQKLADVFYQYEESIIKSLDAVQQGINNRWLSIGRTDIEKGFMCLRKGITERFKEIQTIKESSLDPRNP
jgi:hypothetical protein